MKNKNDLISKEEILQIFNRKIKPRINSLHQERSEVKKKLFLVMLPTAVVIIWIGIHFEMRLDGTVFLLSSALGFEYHYFTRSFISRFKHEVIQEIFSALIPGCLYQKESFVPEDDFSNSHIINNRIDSYSGEDHIQGVLGNMKMEFSEICVKKKIKSSKGRSQYQQLFAGLFFKFSLNKNLGQSTLVLADHAEKFLGKGMARFFQKNSSREGFDLVQMESLEFENHYVVYSDDQIKSRIVLKPTVLESLVKFKKKYNLQIDISIQNDILFIAVHSSKNHFEPRMFGEVISIKDLREIYDFVALAQDLQEDLDLQKVA